jgi:hypothetical protein
MNPRLFKRPWLCWVQSGQPHRRALHGGQRAGVPGCSIESRPDACKASLIERGPTRAAAEAPTLVGRITPRLPLGPPTSSGRWGVHGT